jgi:hypothetical protein
MSGFLGIEFHIDRKIPLQTEKYSMRVLAWGWNALPGTGSKREARYRA